MKKEFTWRSWWFNAFDFRDITFGWDLALKGAYMDLLIHQWQNGSIPWTEDFFKHFFRIGAVEARNYLDHFEAFFEEIVTKGYRRRVCPKLHEYRERRKDGRNKLVDAGKKGAKLRWGNQGSKTPKPKDIADVLQEAQVAANKKKAQEAARPDPIPDTVPHSQVNPIVEVSRHWNEEMKRLDKRKGMRREDVIRMAEFAELHAAELPEVRQRMTAYLEDVGNPTTMGFVHSWANYNASSMDARQEVLKMDSTTVNREETARKQLKREFGDPKAWTPAECKRRASLVKEWVSKRIPENELEGVLVEVQYTATKTLAALQNDRLRNPAFYPELDKVQ